jgi:hypothetical protein
MRSSKHGTSILPSNVTSITSFGFWVINEDKEYFIAFNDYPAFKTVPVDKIFNLKVLSPKQLYWPEMDIDIELDALENPERFPLFYR